MEKTINQRCAEAQIDRAFRKILTNSQSPFEGYRIYKSGYDNGFFDSAVLMAENSGIITMEESLFLYKCQEVASELLREDVETHDKETV